MRLCNISWFFFTINMRPLTYTHISLHNIQKKSWLFFMNHERMNYTARSLPSSDTVFASRSASSGISGVSAGTRWTCSPQPAPDRSRTTWRCNCNALAQLIIDWSRDSLTGPTTACRGSKARIITIWWRTTHAGCIVKAGRWRSLRERINRIATRRQQLLYDRSCAMLSARYHLSLQGTLTFPLSSTRDSRPASWRGTPSQRPWRGRGSTRTPRHSFQ